jgi:parallel beta-helix repeat protein
MAGAIYQYGRPRLGPEWGMQIVYKYRDERSRFQTAGRANQKLVILEWNGNLWYESYDTVDLALIENKSALWDISPSSRRRAAHLLGLAEVGRKIMSALTSRWAIFPVLLIAGGIAATDQALAQLVCGDLIKNNTKLNGDLSDCPANGLVIDAPNITLDLGGYTIDGAGVGNGVDNTNGHERVTIKNGRIRQFSAGVSLNNATRNRLRDLWVSHNSDGIFLSASDDNRIERNTTSDNDITGITLDDGSDDNRVEKNSSIDNANFGIAVEDASNNNHITRNTASDNANSGIFVDTASSGTRIERNVANRNAVDGILVSNAATTLTKNTANNNGGWGINAVAGVTDGGGNEAAGNGEAGQCTTVMC